MADNNIGTSGLRNWESGFTDRASSTPETRQIDNVAAQTSLTKEEIEKHYADAIAYMNSPEAQEFYRLLRRHEANPFNALFKDKEPVTEEDIRVIVKRTSEFFNLPIPTLISRCESLAKIAYSDSVELGSEIQYDPKELSDIGIYNVDAFDLMLTHELSHQFLADKNFNFCISYAWCLELSCDFIVGVRCSAYMIASGKYKYAVSVMKASASHPDGIFRYKAAVAGFKFAEWMRSKEVPITADNSLLGLTHFLCIHSKALNTTYESLEKNTKTVSSETINTCWLN